MRCKNDGMRFVGRVFGFADESNMYVDEKERVILPVDLSPNLASSLIINPYLRIVLPSGLVSIKEVKNKAKTVDSR